MFSVVNVYHDHLKFCVVCINSRRYVCCSECDAVSNECNEPTSCLVQPIGAHCCEVMYFGCFGFRGELDFLIKNPPVTFACDIYLPICMRKLDTHRRSATSNTSNGDEMLPKTPQHIVHRTHNKCGGTQQNRACHWTIRRLAYYCQKKKAKMVWPCLKVFWSLKNDHAGYSQRRKEKGWPEKAMGR